MGRILFFIPFLIWVAWPISSGISAPVAFTGPAIYLLGHVLLVAGIAWYGRRQARRFITHNLRLGLLRFMKLRNIARWLVAGWFLLGVWFLHWHDFVQITLRLGGLPFELPSLLVGTLPPLITWVGLWCAEYPAETALREQNLIYALEESLPVHASPSLRTYLSARLRLQAMFILIPMLILTISDITRLIVILLRPHMAPETLESAHAIAMFLCTVAIFIVAPAILRRILRTEPLPDSPLRRRLLDMAARHNLRCREILLWHTHHHIGNAAVMGIMPRFRYVLLSDLLLETMTDKQIEAVFAHELGHVVYRHMQWYLVIVATLVLGLSAIGSLVSVTIPLDWEAVFGVSLDIVLTLVGGFIFAMIFGFLSRRFERQADVFAARTIKPHDDASTIIPLPRQAALAECVEPYGATLFSSALHRVAVINNIPITAPSWCHGSMLRRMNYLRELSRHPEKTRMFDQLMSRLYAMLLLALLVAGAAVVLISQG